MKIKLFALLTLLIGSRLHAAETKIKNGIEKAAAFENQLLDQELENILRDLEIENQRILDQKIKNELKDSKNIQTDMYIFFLKIAHQQIDHLLKMTNVKTTKNAVMQDKLKIAKNNFKNNQELMHYINTLQDMLQSINDLKNLADETSKDLTQIKQQSSSTDSQKNREMFQEIQNKQEKRAQKFVILLNKLKKSNIKEQFPDIQIINDQIIRNQIISDDAAKNRDSILDAVENFIKTLYKKMHKDFSVQIPSLPASPILFEEKYEDLFDKLNKLITILRNEKQEEAFTLASHYQSMLSLAYVFDRIIFSPNSELFAETEKTLNEKIKLIKSLEDPKTWGEWAYDNTAIAASATGEVVSGVASAVGNAASGIGSYAGSAWNWVRGNQQPQKPASK